MTRKGGSLDLLSSVDRMKRMRHVRRSARAAIRDGGGDPSTLVSLIMSLLLLVAALAACSLLSGLLSGAVRRTIRRHTALAPGSRATSLWTQPPIKPKLKVRIRKESLLVVC